MTEMPSSETVVSDNKNRIQTAENYEADSTATVEIISPVEGIDQKTEAETKIIRSVKMPDVVGLPFLPSSRQALPSFNNILREGYNKKYSSFRQKLNASRESTEGYVADAGRLLTFDGIDVFTMGERFAVRSRANNVVPVGFIVAQEPMPGVPIAPRSEEIVLVVSAGRPAVSFDALPNEIQTLLEDEWHYGDLPWLMINTPYGMAYKNEETLVGTCTAVDAVDGTFLDTRYDTRCYTIPTQIAFMDIVGLAYEKAIEILIIGGIDRSAIIERWIASETPPRGAIIRQYPAAEEQLTSHAVAALDISAGGPVITFDELPDEIIAWLATLPLGAVPFVLDMEPILIVQTSQGVAYKTDEHLFGPCAAVKASYGTFQDSHYDTVTPNPCSRLGDFSDLG